MNLSTTPIRLGSVRLQRKGIFGSEGHGEEKIPSIGLMELPGTILTGPHLILVVALRSV